MARPDTRTQLLDAAERLFAEHGFRGTSIRAVTDLAGANLAAVGYHFGSKADLLAAVARRAVEPITAAQSANLDRLLARTPDPAVADLVEAFAGPLFDGLPGGDEPGARRSRLIVAILTDPAEEMRRWTTPAEDTLAERYLAAFRRALPTLSAGELWFRIRGILAVTAVDRLEAYNTPTTPGGPGRRWAITFLTAAMSAPPS
ncbi:TetR/AcrR family transcriptional regulator [Catenuloplanes atrovinosus]|uniref:AcrR family transcriptional regulator n=1 Tax=Catenuloplanes atrovinosus TaxID=137266 RepID=A0AAE4CB64_9ACTN|nr:TetR/AcrR family transcriptional regulator [Catenuloplanes atrovinosus]MDR7275295.1 AcrR family transcriptional regulator [Catenuloplanes atrovinosus]